MDRTQVLRQAARGGMAVALGGVANQAITAAGGVLLARGLPPEIFGLYGILSYVITFFAFFGDIGFGP
ncbi:MAG: polysaccharide biosynthesis protein, partial [bacterium]